MPSKYESEKLNRHKKTTKNMQRFAQGKVRLSNPEMGTNGYKVHLPQGTPKIHAHCQNLEELIEELGI